MTTKPRKWRVHTSTILVTDEDLLSQFFTKSEELQSENKLHETQALWDDMMKVFPDQSRGARVGNTVAVWDAGWSLVDVTNENLAEIKKSCHFGIVTHQTWKIETLAEIAA